MLKRPALNASATDSPAKMSGVASTSVRFNASVLPSDESKSARYALEETSHDLENASPGSLNRLPHASSASGSVKTMTSAPITSADRIASAVNHEPRHTTAQLI